MHQLKRILTLILFMFTCVTYAQVIYPSNITTTLTPPYSIYLDEYSNPLTPKIKANIVFTDFTEASWDVYLKLKITGSNFTIKSLELQAKQAFDLRNTYRSGARKYMKDRNLAEYLEQNEVNEVWDKFVQATSTKTGKTGDVLWQEIIDKSMHGRERVDELFKLDGL